MKFCSILLRTIAAQITWSLLISLALLAGAESAFAEIAGATCPLDFTCFPPEPRDGVCQHPALVVDTKSKSVHYDDNPFSLEYESACIAQTQSSAVRRDGELLLKLSNGASKIYKDDTTGCENGPDENCKGYTLYDYFPEHRLFLLRVGHYEGGNWLLVSQLDGKEEQIVGPPGYSPSRKWLASANWNEGPGGDADNGIDIVPADFDPRRPAFHYRPSDYEGWEFVRWDGDDRLLLKVTWHGDKDRPTELVTSTAEVVLRYGEWQLKNWPPR